MTTKLPNAKLYFHDVLWSVPWDDIISERNGESKRLLEVMKEMVHVLKSCQNWDATPCAMAWLILWSRNYGITQAALALLECQLTFTGGGQHRMLEVLYRQAMELQLDLMVIANPSEASLGEIDPEKAGEVYDRLCAYLAFCANNESRYYAECTKNYALDAVDSLARFERELGSNTSQYGDSLKELQQALWGDVVGDVVATRVPRRAERRKFAHEQRNCLRRWLEHEDLAHWDHKLRIRHVRSFPALVLDDHKTVQNTLKKYKMGFGYLSYQRASAVVHGSYIGPFMENLGHGFIPSVFEPPENLEREAAHARRFTHNNTFRLLQLREGIADFCIAG